MTSTVLLTATVRPNTLLHVAQADPGERLDQYRVALARWAQLIETSRTDLVVVETSNVTPDALFASVPRRLRSQIRLLSYEALAPDGDLGKGPLEVEAIRHGLTAIEQEFGEGRTVYKGTGRLVLANAPELVRELGVRSARLRMTADRSFADTRFLGASVAVWRHVLLADAQHIDERAGVFLEHVVAGAVARASAIKTVRLERFPVRPAFEGQSGSTGKLYASRALRLPEGLLRSGETLLSAIAGRKQL